MKRRTLGEYALCVVDVPVLYRLFHRLVDKIGKGDKQGSHIQRRTCKYIGKSVCKPALFHGIVGEFRMSFIPYTAYIYRSFAFKDSYDVINGNEDTECDHHALHTGCINQRLLELLARLVEQSDYDIKKAQHYYKCHCRAAVKEKQCELHHEQHRRQYITPCVLLHPA